MLRRRKLRGFKVGGAGFLTTSRLALSTLCLMALVGLAPLCMAVADGAPQATPLLAEANRRTDTARAIKSTDPARAWKLAEDAVRIAETADDDPHLKALSVATAQGVQAEAALRLNHPSEAKPLLEVAFATAKRERPGSRLEADIRVSRARLESTEGEVQSALVDELSAFDIYRKLGDRRQQATALEDMGQLYKDAGDYQRALSYYAQSQETFSGEPILDLSISNNRANALLELGRFGEAEAAYLSALGIARQAHSPALEAEILDNVAIAQMKSGKLQAAKRSVAEGLQIARDPAASSAVSNLLSASAEIAFREGNFAAARTAMDAAVRQGDFASASARDPEIYLTAYRVYKAEGLEAQALKDLEAYNGLQSAHLRLMASANTALMAARFDYENQNARITALRAGELQRDIALTKLRARQGQIVLGGLLVFVTGLIVFMTLYLRTLRRANQATQKINLQLTETNTELEKALTAKTQFLATTSHEIRTPLNGILGLTEVLLADRQLAPNLRQRVSLIHGAGETMRLLVDDLLDMSKIDADQITLQRDVVDLPTLIWEIHRFWLTHAESSGLKLTLDVSRSPILIVEDARRLRQILSNLLSNAVKFTPNGVIALSVETGWAESGETLIIRVADTGIGIPEVSRETIFEKFTQLDAGVTRKYSGTGLGLSIARSLARSMGGDIAIESNMPHGAVFVVTLPLERALLDSPLESLKAKGTVSRSAGLEVLMVESSPITQAGMRSILERRVEALAFTPTLKDAVLDIAEAPAHVVIASMRKRAGEDDMAAGAEIAELARVASEVGTHLVLIADLDHPAVDIYRPLPGVSILARPVNATKLLEHLERLHEVDNTVPALRPKKLQEQGADAKVAESS